MEEEKKVEEIKTPEFEYKADSTLRKSKVYCRIRPVTYDGSGHDQNGEAVAKSLQKWSDKSITLDHQYLFSKGNNVYNFPEKVLGPEVTQEEVYNATMPQLVYEFTNDKPRNVLFLAYGQTGTGKTHTMFGPFEELKTEEL